MDFSRRKRVPKVVAGSLCELYPHDVQLYVVPPICEVTIWEFEDLALERLQLLRTIEQAAHKGHRTYSDDWKNCIVADLRKLNLDKYVRLLHNNGSTNTESDLQARRADHLSHFILRLAYARSEDLRRWFLARELELFRFRFSNLNVAAVKSFVRYNKLDYVPMTTEEKRVVHEYLFESTATLSASHIDTYEFYKVAFTNVTGLVKTRRVYVADGYAYIPSSDLIAAVSTVYRMVLNESLANACRRLPEVDDDRLTDLLQNVHTSYTGDAYNASGDKNVVNIDMLDAYSKKSFPICMRNIHDYVRAVHHAKNSSRIQYGFFLKGIGVRFEDSVRFWRDEFTKLMDGDKFDKQYLYGIKHNYGKVGRMVNYNPLACLKIITSKLSALDHHGCPFRHSDSTSLKKRLVDYGTSEKGITEIQELVSKNNYQLACTKYFELTHGVPSKMVINHPNQYFDDSQSILNPEKE